MRRPVRFLTLVFALLIATLVGAARQARPAGVPVIDVTVQEGTSMSVAVSPDGPRSPSICRAASGRCRAGGGARADHRRLRGRAAATLVAGRQMDHLLRVS